MSAPLVSCLMVTRPSPQRLTFVKRSIDFYRRQTYQPRELMITLDAGSDVAKSELEQYVAGLGRRDICVVRAPGTPSLGQLRNLAIEGARGELMSIWDDDDIHHPLRLEAQVRALGESGAIATFLSEALQLFVTRRELYLTNYKNAEQKCLPGTGVVRRTVKARYPESGPESKLGEDTVFCLRLLEEGSVRFVDDAAQLYIYVSHGGNTSGDDHHLKLARLLGVSRARLLRRESLVRDALAQAGLDLDQVAVQGSNGLAFTWRRGEGHPISGPP